MVAARRGARAAGARGAGARAAVATARAAAMAGVADAAVRLEEPWAASGAEAWVVVTAATAAALALAAVWGGARTERFLRNTRPSPRLGTTREKTAAGARDADGARDGPESPASARMARMRSPVATLAQSLGRRLELT